MKVVIPQEFIGGHFVGIIPPALLVKRYQSVLKGRSHVFVFEFGSNMKPVLL